MKPAFIRPFLAVFAPVVCLAADDFVGIKAGELSPHRIEAFEMAAAPLTNAEYKLFVDATGAKPPQHWQNGTIPAGMEKMPVVFVNRYDADAYVKWRSGKERRIYRLPTYLEFDYAARAGAKDAKYAWGNEAPDASRANYDPKGDRTFAEWRAFLKPVKSYPANAWGLYDMAGNVWQMVNTLPDPAIARFKYRIYDSVDLENGLAGGSWARAEYYLRNGVRGGASPGIRHPDIGFRLVREPQGSQHFRSEVRRLVAVPNRERGIYLGWQWLPGDAPSTGFHVYRSSRREAAGQRITSAPVTDSTNFVDSQPPSGRVYYRVRSVGAGGTEGPPSEWAGVDLADAQPGVMAVFRPAAASGNVVPIFGDLDGDGKLDTVVRLNNGIQEMSIDPGVPVELEAFTSWGRSIWRRPLAQHDRAFGSANNVPVCVFDLDGDGRSEVIARVQEGEDVFLAILDGMTGRVRHKTPWAEMATDFAKSSTRIHMAVAYLNGKTPAIVTQTGLYENEIFEAFDIELKKLWRFESFGETSGSGSHHIDIADLDGDGKDEVLNGTTALNGDGTMRWSIYREHPDIVAVKNILPGRKGRQVYYGVETGVHAGMYVVDAASGKIIWKINREDDPRWVHVHRGWVAEVDESSPGLEIMANRDGHTGKDAHLFTAEGKPLITPFSVGYRPVNWIGRPARDLLSRDGKLFRVAAGKLDPLADATLPADLGSCEMAADLGGDFRDELVCSSKGPDGKPVITVYTNTAPAARRELTRTADREYSLWLARNMGAGYASYFEWEPPRK
jgi:rhamnogalacturonan endolyase